MQLVAYLNWWLNIIDNYASWIRIKLYLNERHHFIVNGHDKTFQLHFFVSPWVLKILMLSPLFANSGCSEVLNPRDPFERFLRCYIGCLQIKYAENQYK